MPYRVLLVEDDLDTLELFKSYLEVHSFDIVTATNGAEALEILKQNRFDLLITDIRMPKMSGLELIKQSRNFHPELPVIIVSGAGTLSEAAEAVNLRVYHYLHKPISDLEILKKVALDAIALYSPNLAEDNQRLKEENAHLKSLLKEIYRMPDVGIIFAGAVHNINSPLGGVMGYAQLIALKNPELKGLNIINEQAGKISKYLSLLGEKWQTETNYDKTIINLKNLIEREAEYLNFNLYYKHQVEKNFVLEMVPSIHGVYRHFSQVFHHLMQNALHSVYESPKKCIEVSLQKIAHEIVLRIKDSGAGLHQEDFAKIFTLGYTTKPKPWEVEEPEIPSGLGLGLFIVNEILKSYQAKINIESKVNAGTTVTVEIPLEN